MSKQRNLHLECALHSSMDQSFLFFKAAAWFQIRLGFFHTSTLISHLPLLRSVYFSILYYMFFCFFSVMLLQWAFDSYNLRRYLFCPCLLKTFLGLFFLLSGSHVKALPDSAFRPFFFIGRYYGQDIWETYTINATHRSKVQCWQAQMKEECFLLQLATHSGCLFSFSFFYDTRPHSSFFHSLASPLASCYLLCCSLLLSTTLCSSQHAHYCALISFSCCFHAAYALWRAMLSITSTIICFDNSIFISIISL